MYELITSLEKIFSAYNCTGGQKKDYIIEFYNKNIFIQKKLYNQKRIYLTL